MRFSETLFLSESLKQKKKSLDRAIRKEKFPKSLAAVLIVKNESGYGIESGCVQKLLSDFGLTDENAMVIGLADEKETVLLISEILTFWFRKFNTKDLQEVYRMIYEKDEEQWKSCFSF